MNYIPCDSACLLIELAANNLVVLSVSCCVGKNYFPAHTNLGLLPVKTQCRWYLPTFVVNPIAEQQYLSLDQKLFNILNYLVFKFTMLLLIKSLIL